MKSRTAQLANAQSMGASFNSKGVCLDYTDLFGIQVICTGSPDGTLTLEYSDDNVPISNTSDPAANVVNWDTLADSSTSVSAAGKFGWNHAQMGHLWIRVVYTRVSGSGSCTINFSSKVDF